jgi:pimeloyl-ACP methyl ester carboxylesterase
MATCVKTYVLVHGAYHGGWCWKDVASRLRASGHVVHTPTLTGLGERSHLMSIQPTLETFIQDVAHLLRFEELEDVVLVGHSFAGSIVSALADRVRDQLRHLVYLDAQVVQSGEAIADKAPPSLIDTYRQRAREHDGLSIPPGSPEYFGITDPTLAAWVMGKLTPHPLQSYFDPLVLANPLLNGLPATYIACSQPFFPATESSRQLARGRPGWCYRELPTGHDAMLLAPAELSAMLAELG